MNFKVERDELVRTLEIILETQHQANDMLCSDSVFYKASDMLLTIQRLPLECGCVYLSEQEALFLAEYL